MTLLLLLPEASFRSVYRDRLSQYAGEEPLTEVTMGRFSFAEMLEASKMVCLFLFLSIHLTSAIAAPVPGAGAFAAAANVGRQADTGRQLGKNSRSRLQAAPGRSKPQV